MTRFGWLIFVALLFPSHNFALSDKVLKLELDSQGKKRAYYLYVPSTISTSSPVPLIVMFHGSGRNGLSLVERWKDLASKKGFILVGPDAVDSRAWTTPHDAPEPIHDLVESLKAKYPINPRKVYLFGHSAGAVFALSLSMLESEYFAATAIHAGAWRDSTEFKAIDYAKRKTPIAIVVGNHDNFFPLAAVKATEEALKQNGFKIEVNVINGHNHSYYDRAAQVNLLAWDFLEKHALEADPRHEQYRFDK